MKIKRRHINMARAAWRSGIRAHTRCSFEVVLAVTRWERAANHKGSKQ